MTKKTKYDSIETIEFRAAMKNIISVSRRTDIPALYTEWFVKRLREKYVFVQHPYRKDARSVSLEPDDILGFVFWSKNFSPLLSRIEDVEKVSKRLFFHFTITGLPREIEINTPPWEHTIRDFIFISRRYSPDAIIWRFDPICLTDKISFQEQTEIFSSCAERLRGFVHTCYISFVHPYRKTVRNFQRYTKHSLRESDDTEKRNHARALARIAGRYGIDLYACCNSTLLSEDVSRGSCINRNRLLHVWRQEGTGNEKRSPTRPDCACTRSIDIGAYDTCPQGCVYCYANSDREASERFFGRHDSQWNSLHRNVEAAGDCRNNIDLYH